MVNTSLLEIEIEGFNLESAKSIKPQGLTIDRSLKFDMHTPNVCMMTILSVIRMFWSNIFCRNIEQVQEKCLRIVYNEPYTSLQEPLNHYHGISVGHLKTLGIQMGYPIGVLIWVVVKINDQTPFRFILLSWGCQLVLPN